MMEDDLDLNDAIPQEAQTWQSIEGPKPHSFVLETDEATFDCCGSHLPRYLRHAT